MVKVSEGRFKMGDNDGPFDEKDEHKVYLDSFYIDVYEVSASQFAAFLNTFVNNETAKTYAKINCPSCTIMHGDMTEVNAEKPWDWRKT